MHIDRFRVRGRDTNALRRCRSDDTGRFKHKEQALEHLAKGVGRLSHLQELLFAQDRYALLLIFQGMDASGKDGTIKHVMSGVNQGGQVRALGPGSTYQTSADPKFVLEEPLTVQVYQSAAVVTGVQAPGGARRVRFVRLWLRDGR